MQNHNLDIEEVDLLQDLKKSGVEVKSVWDLVNGLNNYDQALPVLIEHLEKNYSERLIEGIVRALTIPAAKGMATTPLIKVYKKLDDTTTVGAKWAVANALSVVIVPQELPLLVSLIQDQSHGLSREMFVRPLFRLAKKDPKIMQLLKKIAQENNEVGEEVEKILNKFKEK